MRGLRWQAERRRCERVGGSLDDAHVAKGRLEIRVFLEADHIANFSMPLVPA